jgi:cytochrome P450
MIFYGTDTMTFLIEWTMEELVLNPESQKRYYEDLHEVVEREQRVRDEDIPNLSYIQYVVKETLIMHPPGPLLSWECMSTKDVNIIDIMCVPVSMTTMVNVWSITHDPHIWDSPHDFCPERFFMLKGGKNVDVRGNYLRLTPFSVGRRVFPRKALGLTTVNF